MGETLATLRDRVEAELRDSSNATWSTGEIDAHIRRALRAYERVDPQRLDTTIQSALDTREYSLSSVTGLLSILDMWYPYDSSSPQYPPNRVAWSRLVGGTLYLHTDDGPSGDAADDIRLFYTAQHTIEGLDGESTSTLDAQGDDLIVVGAVAFAALQHAGDLVGAVTVSGRTPRQMMDWGNLRMQAFDEGLGKLANRLILDADSRAVMAGDV